MLGHPDRDVTRTPPQACVGQAPGAPPAAFQSLTWERKTATDTSKRLAAAKTTSIPPDSARWPMKSIGWSVRWRRGQSGFARWPRSRSCSRRSCFSLAHRVRRCIRRRHMPAAGRFTPELRQERAANAAQRARKPASRSSRARMPQDEKPQANQCTGAVSRATGNCRRPHHMFDHQQ